MFSTNFPKIFSRRYAHSLSIFDSLQSQALATYLARVVALAGAVVVAGVLDCTGLGRMNGDSGCDGLVSGWVDGIVVARITGTFT